MEWEGIVGIGVWLGGGEVVGGGVSEDYEANSSSGNDSGNAWGWIRMF